MTPDRSSLAPTGFQHLVFTSDLHLRRPDEEKARSLENLIKNLAGPGTVLVLGGDVFDLFVGSKDFFRLRFKSLIREMDSFLERAGTLVYLEGNHDFQLADLFSGARSGTALVFSEDFSLTLGSRRVFVSHGDQINRRDYGYLFLRAFLRSWPLRALIRILPGDLIGGIGDWSSRKSRAYTGIKREDSPRIQATRDLFRGYADERFREGYDLVLLGHTHIEDDYRGEGSGKSHQMLNLGFDSHELFYVDVKVASGGGSPATETWSISGRRVFV